jgi:phage repressor protein C with HTH and peptisase S24 domain
MNTIPEILITLQNLTNSKISQTDIAKALGTGRSNISLRAKNKSELTIDEIKKIEKYFNVEYREVHILTPEESNNLENGFIDIPVRGEVEASMGYGVTVLNEAQTATYSISRKLAKDLNISINASEIIFARGNSMLPTIEGGDSLLIDLSKKDIYDGKIYCIRYDGQLYAKRLQKISTDKIKIISDNKDYDPVIIDFSSDYNYDFEVIGEVRWAGRIFK